MFTSGAVNDGMPEHVVEMVQRVMGNKGSVAVLGLTFKAGVDDTRESPAVEVTKCLIEAGLEVRAFDPHVCNLPALKNHLVTSVDEAIQGVDVVVILVDHTDVLDLGFPIEHLLAEMKRQTGQNIRRGETVGLIVREGTQRDLDCFYELHRATSQRQGFYPYPKNYYLHMWRIFGSQDLIHRFMVEQKGGPITALLQMYPKMPCEGQNKNIFRKETQHEFSII